MRLFLDGRDALQPGGASPGATAMRCDSFLAGEERGGATPGVAIKISPASKTSPRDASGLVDDMGKLSKIQKRESITSTDPDRKQIALQGSFPYQPTSSKQTTPGSFRFQATCFLRRWFSSHSCMLTLSSSARFSTTSRSSVCNFLFAVQGFKVQGSRFRVQGSGSS